MFLQADHFECQNSSHENALFFKSLPGQHIIISLYFFRLQLLQFNSY